MPKFRVQPHLMASRAAASWDGWFQVLESERRPLGSLLHGWDYDQTLRLGTSPAIDAAELQRSTGLETLEHVHLVVSVDCASTARRFTASLPIRDYLAGPDPFLEVLIPAGQAALEVKMSSQIVLLSDTEESGFRASRKGSRLAESQAIKLILEGEASRFPTEALSFKDLRWEHAAWSVRVDMEEMDEAFSGSVRLILNSDHPVGTALAAMEPMTYRALGSILRIDIVRSVLMTAIEHVTKREGRATGFDEESFGAVAEQMCADYFDTGLASVAELRHSDPARFERILQASVGMELAQQ